MATKKTIPQLKKEAVAIQKECLVALKNYTTLLITPFMEKKVPAAEKKLGTLGKKFGIAAAKYMKAFNDDLQAKIKDAKVITTWKDAAVFFNDPKMAKKKEVTKKTATKKK